MKGSILTGITLLVSVSVHSMDFTLEEAIQFALKNNNVIQAQEADLDSSKGTVISGFSGFLPKVDAKLSYFLGEQGYKIESTIPANSFGPGFPPTDLTTGFNSESFTYDYTFGITLTQPLFAGGKIWNGYQMSLLGKKMQEEKLREVRNNVAFQVTDGFYRVLVAKGFFEVSKDAKALADEHLRVARARYRAGEATEYEVLRAEVESANLDTQLIRAENAVKLAELSFKTVLGINRDEDINLIGELEPVEFNMTMDECIKNAKEKRPEIIQLEYQKQLAKKNYRFAVGGYMPNLAFVGNYQSLTNKVNTARIFDRPEDKWLDSYSFMLVLSVPIFDGLYNYGKIREARSGIRKVNEINLQLEKGVILEIQQAYSSLEEARKVLSAGKKNVETAQRAVEIAQVQYKNGLITSVELLSAEVGLTQAKTSYLQAKYDYLIAVAKLKKAMGEDIE
jgi:outer membrane protein TolC